MRPLAMLLLVLIQIIVTQISLTFSLGHHQYLLRYRSLLTLEKVLQSKLQIRSGFFPYVIEEDLFQIRKVGS